MPCIIIVNHVGEIASSGSTKDGSLGFPCGFIRKANPKLQQTLTQKINTMLGSCINAVTGPATQIDFEHMVISPYASKVTDGSVVSNAKKWERAVGDLFLPMVVPVNQFGEDPDHRYEITWADPSKTQRDLQADFNDLGTGYTRLALDALEVAGPDIATVALAAAALRPAAPVS